MSSCSGLSGPCSYVRYLTGRLHFFICLSCQDQQFWTIILQSDGPCYSQLTVQKQWRHLFVSALIFSMYECDASAFSFIPYRIDTDRIQDSGETGAVTSATTSARFTQLSASTGRRIEQVTRLRLHYSKSSSSIRRLRHSLHGRSTTFALRRPACLQRLPPSKRRRHSVRARQTRYAAS